jgi:hypothetical protein
LVKGLAGQTEFEQLKVDELAEWFKDIWRDYVPLLILENGTKEVREMFGLQNTSKVIF